MSTELPSNPALSNMTFQMIWGIKFGLFSWSLLSTCHMNWPESSNFSSCHLFFCSFGCLCWQWFGEGRGIVEALREEGRLEDRGPVCWPAQINFTVHCLRSLQRDVWSLLGSLSAYPAVQQIQRQVAALPRSFRQGRNTRRRWKARKDQTFRHFDSRLSFVGLEQLHLFLFYHFTDVFQMSNSAQVHQKVHHSQVPSDSCAP